MGLFKLKKENDDDMLDLKKIIGDTPAPPTPSPSASVSTTSSVPKPTVPTPGSSSSQPQQPMQPTNNAPNMLQAPSASPSGASPFDPATPSSLQSSQQSMQQPQPQQGQAPQFINPFAQQSSGMNQSSSVTQPMGQPPQQNQMMNQPQQNFDREEIENLVQEVIEVVLDEKFATITDNFKKIISWREKIETEIASVKDEVTNLKDGFDRLEKRIFDKISDYDKGITNVGMEIKALEKVFQKVTPTLVNNVNELAKITKNLRSHTAADPKEKDVSDADE